MSKAPKDSYDMVMVKGIVVESSVRAYKFRAEGSNRYHWLPKSQVTWMTETTTIAMPKWLARDKGYIE